MKADKLIDAIGMIDDEYINEAHSSVRKKFSLSWELLGKLASAAICLLLIINIFPILFKSANYSNSGGSTSYNGADSYEYTTDTYIEPSQNALVDNEAKTSQLEKDSNKKLILTANMNLETQDLDDASNKLNNLIEKYNAYFQSNSIYYSGSNTRILNASIRIPADNYSSFIEEVKQIANTTSYSEKTDDVTESYMDIEARLNSLKAQEEKVLEFYDKATTIEDLMAIESRLADLRYEIESYESRIKNYDLLIEYSTLNIYISETKAYTTTSPNFFTRLTNAFINGFNNFIDSVGDFMIEIVYNIWTILLIVLIGFIAYFVYKRFIKRNKA